MNRLIEDGADVNYQPDSEDDLAGKTVPGWTALMHAVVLGHTELVKLLVAKGADTNARGQLCKLSMGCGAVFSVLDLAKESGNSEIINFLKKNGAR